MATNITTPILEYLEPTSSKTRKSLIVPPVGQLAGKRIAFVNNGWVCFTKMGIHIDRLLREKHGIASMSTFQIPPSAAPAPGLLERIADEADAAIVGLAN